MGGRLLCWLVSSAIVSCLAGVGFGDEVFHQHQDHVVVGQKSVSGCSLSIVG